MQMRYHAGCFALVALGHATGAAAYTGEELAQKAKVTIDQARSIALKARHGTITDEELEREKGGSGLRYFERDWIEDELHDTHPRVTVGGLETRP